MGMLDRNQALRRQAWAYGRALRNRLLNEYRQENGVEFPPPPALIVDELLADFLQAELRYLPLSSDLYAQTEYVQGRVIVTVNSLIARIPGVKYAKDVQNVGKFRIYRAYMTSEGTQGRMQAAVTQRPERTRSARDDDQVKERE